MHDHTEAICQHCSHAAAAAGWTLADIDSLGRCLLGREKTVPKIGNRGFAETLPTEAHKHTEKPAKVDALRRLSFTAVGGSGCFFIDAATRDFDGHDLE